MTTPYADTIPKVECKAPWPHDEGGFGCKIRDCHECEYAKIIEE